MHDTPFRSTLVWPVGLGLGTTVHTVPFHCSVNPRSPPPDVPTAMHVVGAVHETALRNPPPAGLGVASSVQVGPFELERDRRVRAAAEVGLSHGHAGSWRSVHETPRRDVLLAPAALGLPTVLHVVPFHWSTRVLVPRTADGDTERRRSCS